MSKAKNNQEPANNDNKVLATVLFRFFYKDKFGKMGSELIEILGNDSELAIATFEKNFPDITWRSFIAL